MIIMMMIVIMIVVVFILAWIMPFFVLDVRFSRHALQVSLELAVPLLLRQRTDLHVDVTSRHLRLLIHMPHVV